MSEAERQVGELPRYFGNLITDFAGERALGDLGVGVRVSSLCEEVPRTAGKRLAVEATVDFEAVDLNLINRTVDGVAQRIETSFLHLVVFDVVMEIGKIKRHATDCR